MQHIQPPFQIFNASAGSGKTFLLVQKYLTKLLGGRPDEQFNRMMALTFTNKAVFEMKYRILLQLHVFATSREDLSAHPMGQALMASIAIDAAELQQRAKRSLQAILHDYAAFDVITLDSFTHRVIRTFAKDLGLAYNFDVALEVDDFLEEIVDRVLDQVGQQPALTSILEQFTFEKMEDDKVTSWELKKNLMDAAKLLLNENDRSQIQKIAQLSTAEQKAQQLFLLQKKKTFAHQLTSIGEKTLLLFKANGIEAAHFTRKTLYNKCLKLSQGKFDGFDEGKLYQSILDGNPLYPQKVPSAIKQCIDALRSEIVANYENAWQTYHLWQITKDIQKQWIPLSLVTSLAKALDAYQNETNKVLLSTFNERIAKEILLQPTPYIYERLGENYRHYFLDEFQDTSTLQWENLVPLIETALVSLNEEDRTGSLMLVGDPKQSIYRWRGGNVDQFIGLIEQGNPFQVPKAVNHLAVNYRSAKQIVTFNNALYESLTAHLSYPENKALFGERAQQETFSAKEGLVHLTFFPDEKLFREDPYTTRIIEQINRCKQQGYSLADMVVLVRKKKQAESVAKALTQASIPTITTASLQLQENEQVKFLASLFQLYFNPKENMVKKIHLHFLYPLKARKEDLHQFLLSWLPQDLERFWREEGIAFDFSCFDHRALNRVMEKACAVFPGINAHDPFVRAFLDLVFDFSQKEEADPLSFLQFWEKKKEGQSLAISPDSLGVRILTIHQAKGLEFPIVFLPFADSLIHANHNEKVWLSSQSIFGDQLPLAWIGYSKRLLNYGPEGEKVYHKKKQEEELDAWNVFYVATTRASEQLYLYANEKNVTKESYVKVLAALSPPKADQNENQTVFSWGSPSEPVKKDPEKSLEKPVFIQEGENYPYEQRLVLQLSKSETMENARLLGLRIHDLLGKINYADEIESVLAEAYLQGEINLEAQEKLAILFQKIAQNELLKDYYSRDYDVLNEKAILVPKHSILRPDRVGVGQKDAYVIDYKTGKEKAEHADQVLNYAKWVEKITQKKVAVFLIYLDYEVEKQVNIRKLA